MGECGQFKGSIGELNIPFSFSSPFDLLARSRLEGLNLADGVLQADLMTYHVTLQGTSVRFWLATTLPAEVTP